MKDLKIGNLKVKVCEHGGDINYLRFVKFKQWAPQFWEKMDVPSWLFAFEKFKELHNKGKHAEGIMVWHDYGLALKQTKELSFDAWGICFALICILEGEDPNICPDEVELRKKIDTLTVEGLTAGQVKDGVVNFMLASPVEFAELLNLYVLPSLPKGIENV